MSERTTTSADCVVVGAGPAGLAAARGLARTGRRVVVLEKGDGVATSWRAHRHGLRLHTVRRLSGLPGRSIPRAYGRYVSSADLVRYFEDYATGHSLDIRFGVSVDTVRRESGARWSVNTASGERFLASTLVVATGHNRVPHIPRWAGRDDYRRPLIHVSEYQDARDYRGLDVLVVGAGNAAAEAATDLARAGAGRVRMAVRTPPHIVRRRVGPLSSQVVAILVGRLPVTLADRVADLIAALTVPDLSAMNLPRPRRGLYSRVERDSSVPVQDTGIVELVRRGAVEPVAAVVGFEPAAVRLADGSLVTPDVVIAATGYRRALESILPGTVPVGDIGSAAAPSGRAVEPGLYFAGFSVSATGALRDIAKDARRIARSVKRSVDPVV